MNAKQLSYIISIAEKQNLSSAATALGVSQPALSKYLAELEAELETELFLRHKKKLYLTPAGKIYVEAARHMIAVKEQTYQTIFSLSATYQKTITIGVTPLRGAIAIARIFPIFRKQYPHVNLVIKEQYPAQLHNSVLNHSVDLALRTCFELNGDPDVTYISANEEDLVLFVPSFHPLASLASSDLHHLTSIEISRFQDSPFLIGHPGSTLRHMSDMIFHQNQMHPTIVYESDNNLILKNMANNGAGITLLPITHAEPSKSLVYFRLKPNYTTHLALMMLKNHILSEEERYLAALNFASEMNSNYRLNPTPLAKEIMDEFKLSNIFY